LLSFNIFFTEKANDRVTANGKPYGMATTTTVNANMKYSRSYFRSVDVSQVFDIPFSIPNLISKMIRIKVAENRPNLPIS
jgi:hypothetical protein